MQIRVLILFLAVALLMTLSEGLVANSMGQEEPFVDRPGGDYHSYQANNRQQCAMSCGSIARCQAYTFVTATRTCWLKDSVPEPRKDPCCFSGVRLMGNYEINFDRLGGDLRPGFPAGSPAECERSCKMEDQCRAYTWVKPGIQAATGMCWLKGSHRPQRADNCCVSGVKLRDQSAPIGPTAVPAPTGPAPSGMIPGVREAR
jgi:hypothetical protein